MTKYRITWWLPDGTNRIFETDNYTIGSGGYVFINLGTKSIRFNGTWSVEENAKL